VIERVPRTLRHRDRAVTLEDYEDLARATSPEVARSLCVPLRDLAADPLDSAPKPGAVSVIVVPRTTDARPMPSLELLDRVGDFLRARADATANVSVIGPLYLRVDVTLEVAVTVDEDVEAVERAINHRLAAFLHPLSGGVDGKGWEFGRASHRSDLLALIESVPGVDHVRYLNIVETEDQAGVRETGRFLVFSGRHRINMTVVES
jgi:predicted phage baseplate assembly protein